MTKISHISWGGYDKGFYGKPTCFSKLYGKFNSKGNGEKGVFEEGNGKEMGLWWRQGLVRGGKNENVMDLMEGGLWDLFEFGLSMDVRLLVWFCVKLCFYCYFMRILSRFEQYLGE